MFGKQEMVMEDSEFSQIMANGEFKKESHKAFFVLLYYLGVRKSEALRLLRMDFTITEEYLHINHYPLKHGLKHKGFTLDRSLPYLDILIEWLVKLKPAMKVFPFSGVTAWHIIKRAAGREYYPHYFRLNRVVKFLRKKELTLDEIRGWMCWTSLSTVDNYLGFSERSLKKMGKPDILE